MPITSLLVYSHIVPIYCNIYQIEEIFKYSAIVRTNWASHVILLNSKLPLGECYWYITQAVAIGWSRNILQVQIESNLFAWQITAKKVSNFSAQNHQLTLLQWWR